MSFSRRIKDEISQRERTETESSALLSAFIRANAKISKNKIEMTTENLMTSKKIHLLFDNLYQVKAKTTSNKNKVFNRSHLFEIVVDEKLDIILKDLSIWDEKKKQLKEIKDYLIGGEEEKRAYLAGSFLSSGSINDPKTSSYHMEIIVADRFEAVLIQKLLNSYDLNSKILKRDKKYMIYIKEAEKISDFLKIISVHQAVLYYENERTYRFQKNVVNRLNNCEQANVDKIIETANRQIADINLIEEMIGLDALDEKTKETAIYRRKYPESSLAELSEIISMETKETISKSGINHRLRRIREIASKLKK